MYKTSSDRRFIKNKKAIQRAYIDLIIEKGYQRITVTDVAERADINRMTFYAHYETVEDIFTEFVDDMENYIKDAVLKEEIFNLDSFFEILNSLMYKEEQFFRYVAKAGNCADFREAFRKAIKNILRTNTVEEEHNVKGDIERDLTATVIAFSYLDWLSGEYGDIGLHEIIQVTTYYLKERISYLNYNR